MTEELVKLLKLQERVKARKKVMRALDHSSLEPGGNDLKRTFEHDKVALKHREKAKYVFRHTRTPGLSSTTVPATSVENRSSSAGGRSDGREWASPYLGCT